MARLLKLNELGSMKDGVSRHCSFDARGVVSSVWKGCPGPRFVFALDGPLAMASEIAFPSRIGSTGCTRGEGRVGTYSSGAGASITALSTAETGATAAWVGDVELVLVFSSGNCCRKLANRASAGFCELLLGIRVSFLGPVCVRVLHGKGKGVIEPVRRVRRRLSTHLCRNIARQAA